MTEPDCWCIYGSQPAQRRRERIANAISMGIWEARLEDLHAAQVDEAYRLTDLVMRADITALIDASSLGTPEAKAARESVTDEQAQRAIDVANRIRSVQS